MKKNLTGIQKDRERTQGCLHRRHGSAKHPGTVLHDTTPLSSQPISHDREMPHKYFILDPIIDGLTS
jgi:hypothetical protein